MIFLQKIRNILSRFRTSEFDRFRYRYLAISRYTPCTIHFRSLTFKVADVASVIWQIKETFFDEHLKFNSNSPEPVILDCGSNAGVTVIYFKKLFPSARITAFEADPEIANILKNNLVSNGITDVSIITKAVWKNNEDVDFSSDGADGGSIYGKNPRIKIPAIRLKDVIVKNEKVDMLKMDIEGAETEVLADCSGVLQHVHYLFVEYHSFGSRPQTLDEILAIFSANNFRYSIEHEGRRHDNFTSKEIKNGSMDFQVNIYATNQTFTKK